MGNKVDIATSSPILAKRDCIELKKLYSFFNISSGFNTENEKDGYDIDEIKNCYNQDIVYGDAHHFQADILRKIYKKANIMGERTQQVVIVDEVDSMLIDGSNHLTLLS